jgi:predicted nucleic-acid-binding Zn-ribbon protein
MSLGFTIECPKCHADRTLLEPSFALPGYVDSRQAKTSAETTTMAGAMPVRIVLCVRCHYLELYHDVGLGKLS